MVGDILDVNSNRSHNMKLIIENKLYTDYNLFEPSWNEDDKIDTVFTPLATQGAYQSHFRWAHIKTLISRFFSLKLVIFEKKNQWKII